MKKEFGERIDIVEYKHMPREGIALQSDADKDAALTLRQQRIDLSVYYSQP
ncbi:MAG: hypothetical protein AAGU74_11835 [Bacillota bacterium]